jgi:hypothetical protein
MNINFEEILKELEYRVESGIIDLTKEEQVTKLAEILTENGIVDSVELAQKARVYFSYINEAPKKQPLEKVLTQKFVNPDTDREVTVASALGYEKNKKAYGIAQGMMRTAGYSNKDIDMVDAGPDDEEKPKGKKLGGSDFASSAEKSTKVKDLPRIDKNVRNSIKEFENFLSDKQKTAIKLSEKQRILELRKLDTLSESFKKLPKEVKNDAAAVFAKGQIYMGRENSGIGKNRMGFLDVKTLNSNRDYLIKSYGTGSPEEIKKFVRNSRKIKVNEEYVESSFNLLPDALQSALMGKGKTGDSGKDKHFLGYVKKDGTITSDQSDPNINKDKKGNLQVKRGNPGNRDRGKFVWRCILEQGGQDPYTGLPLDLSSIDLEHVRAFDNKDTGNPTPTDYLNREHDNNIIICATNINQKKSNLSMKKFYEMHVNPQVGKSQESFKKETETYETINEVASQTDQKAGLAIKNGKLKPGYNFKNLKELFESDDVIYQNAKNEFKKVAETDEDRKAIAGLNSEIGRGVLMSMGLGRGIMDKSGRRTIKLSSDNLYRGFLLSMAEQPNKQDKFKAAWENARKIANSDKFRLKGQGQQAMIKYLISNKFISKNVLNDPKLGKVFNSALSEVYDYDNNVYVLYS